MLFTWLYKEMFPQSAHISVNKELKKQNECWRFEIKSVRPILYIAWELEDINQRNLCFTLLCYLAVVVKFFIPNKHDG